MPGLSVPRTRCWAASPRGTASSAGRGPRGEARPGPGRRLDVDPGPARARAGHRPAADGRDREGASSGTRASWSWTRPTAALRPTRRGAPARAADGAARARHVLHLREPPAERSSARPTASRCCADGAHGRQRSARDLPPASRKIVAMMVSAAASWIHAAPARPDRARGIRWRWKPRGRSANGGRFASRNVSFARAARRRGARASRASWAPDARAR